MPTADTSQSTQAPQTASAPQVADDTEREPEQSLEGQGLTSSLRVQPTVDLNHHPSFPHAGLSSAVSPAVSNPPSTIMGEDAIQSPDPWAYLSLFGDDSPPANQQHDDRLSANSRSASPGISGKKPVKAVDLSETLSSAKSTPQPQLQAEASTNQSNESLHEIQSRLEKHSLKTAGEQQYADASEKILTLAQTPGNCASTENVSSSLASNTNSNLAPLLPTSAGGAPPAAELPPALLHTLATLSRPPASSSFPVAQAYAASGIGSAQNVNPYSNLATAPRPIRPMPHRAWQSNVPLNRDNSTPSTVSHNQQTQQAMSFLQQYMMAQNRPSSVPLSRCPVPQMIPQYHLAAASVPNSQNMPQSATNNNSLFNPRLQGPSGTGPPQSAQGITASQLPRGNSALKRRRTDSLPLNRPPTAPSGFPTQVPPTHVTPPVNGPLLYPQTGLRPAVFNGSLQQGDPGSNSWFQDNILRGGTPVTRFPPVGVCPTIQGNARTGPPSVGIPPSATVAHPLSSAPLYHPRPLVPANVISSQHQTAANGRQAQAPTTSSNNVPAIQQPSTNGFVARTPQFYLDCAKFQYGWPLNEREFKLLFRDLWNRKPLGVEVHLKDLLE